jgi:hypothetical protein
MKFRRTALGIILWLPFASSDVLAQDKRPLPRTIDEGRAYLEHLYQNRSAITSGYVEFTHKIHKYEKEPSLEGSERTWRYWFDQDRFRVDLKETRPNDPNNALDARYSYSDGIYRIIDVDKPNFVVREYTKDFLGQKDPGGIPVTRFDTRLLGVIGIDFELLQHDSLQNLLDIQGELLVEPIEADGRRAVQITVAHPRGLRYSYVLTNSYLLPESLSTQFATENGEGRSLPDIRVQVESEVALWPNSRGQRFEFPRFLRFRRIVEGKIQSEETLSTRAVNFNVPVDASDLTWVGLQPASGAALAYNGQYKANLNAKERLAWSGDRFEVVRHDPFDATGGAIVALAGRDRGDFLRSASYILLTSAGLLTLVALTLWRVRQARLDRNNQSLA